MIVHLYMFGEEEITKETSKVTMFEDGSSFGFPGRVLILGTKPDVEVHPLIKIKWFFVEEN